jgi:hypothetical protein
MDFFRYFQLSGYLKCLIGVFSRTSPWINDGSCCLVLRSYTCMQTTESVPENRDVTCKLYSRNKFCIAARKLRISHWEQDSQILLWENPLDVVRCLNKKCRTYLTSWRLALSLSLAPCLFRNSKARYRALKSPPLDHTLIQIFLASK